jgi:hypothetical protein
MCKWMSSLRAGSALRGLILGSMLTLVVPAAARANPALIPTTETQVLELANLERAVRGIRPLAHDGRLAQVAREWAHRLANEGRIYHMDTLPARGLGYKAGGENIVLGVPKITALYAHIQVMQSDLHRKNLLDPAFSHAAVGMSCATVNGTNFAVAVIQFGADAPPSTAVPSAQPQVVQGDIKAGPGVTCEGFAPPPPPGPAPEPPPPPAPASAPTPAAPVVKTVPAPKPAPAPVPVPAPAVAPVPVPAPVELPPPPAPAPEPPAARSPDPVEVNRVWIPAGGPGPVEPVDIQASVPVYQQTDVMLMAGFFGTMLLISLSLAMLAGGSWAKRCRTAKAES